MSKSHDIPSIEPPVQDSPEDEFDSDVKIALEIAHRGPEDVASYHLPVNNPPSLTAEPDTRRNPDRRPLSNRTKVRRGVAIAAVATATSVGYAAHDTVGDVTSRIIDHFDGPNIVYVGESQPVTAQPGDSVWALVAENVDGAYANNLTEEVVEYVVNDPANLDTFLGPDGTVSHANLNAYEQVMLPEKVTVED